MFDINKMQIVNEHWEAVPELFAKDYWETGKQNGSNVGC